MNSSSRDAILQRIAANLGGSEKSRKSEVTKRIKQHSRGTMPDIVTAEKPKQQREELVKRFCDKAQAASASVVRVKRSEIAKAVSAFLRDHNLPQSLRMGSDKRLKQIAWPKRGGPELLVGDALTIEPGLYCLALGGVRVEDMVIVTRDGCENLNTLPEGLAWS